MEENIYKIQFKNEQHLSHHASEYYDPVKAHEYYEEHKQLKGRKSVSGNFTSSTRNKNIKKDKREVDYLMAVKRPFNKYVSNAAEFIINKGGDTEEAFISYIDKNIPKELRGQMSEEVINWFYNKVLTEAKGKQKISHSGISSLYKLR